MTQENARDRNEKDPWKDIGTDKPEKRPGPFAQDPSREPPSKEQRERDYARKISQTS